MDARKKAKKEGNHRGLGYLTTIGDKTAQFEKVCPKEKTY